jgi:hypothetical protein
MKDSTRKRLQKYFERTWLPLKEHFCHAWTDNCIHFGQWATSRVEGSHNALKRALKVSIGDLKHVVDTMELLVIKQVDEYKYQLNASKIRLVRAHQIPLFDWAVEYVLLVALDLVLDNYKKLKEGEISQECSGVFETTMGLPCAHTCEKRQT